MAEGKRPNPHPVALRLSSTPAGAVRPPHKPYAWKGEPEPPEVTAARERYRAREAELDAGRDPDRCDQCGRFATAAGHQDCAP